LKQAEKQEENLQQTLHEMSKPLARYADDEDLEQHLRDQEREGDPMLEYIRSKKTEGTTNSELLCCTHAAEVCCFYS
jgi:pre-mRNA-splicing factor CWC26